MSYFIMFDDKRMNFLPPPLPPQLFFTLGNYIIVQEKRKGSLCGYSEAET